MQETRDVLMSIHPKWIELILQGVKTREVRKRAPLQRAPFKVYLYCTKGEEAWMAGVKGKRDSYQMNGMVCGEATCVSIIEYSGPFRNSTYGTCLTERELIEYAGPCGKVCYMALENPVTYDKPKDLSEFGLKHPPMSWQYVKDTNETDRGGVKS